MIQLRLFVHQRLYTAAEEILGEVEKTITLALHEAEVSQSEGLSSLRHQLTLDLLRKQSGLGLRLNVKHRLYKMAVCSAIGFTQC